MKRVTRLADVSQPITYNFYRIIALKHADLSYDDAYSVAYTYKILGHPCVIQELSEEIYWKTSAYRYICMAGASLFRMIE